MNTRVLTGARRHDVILMSMRRIASASMRRRFDIICLLGIIKCYIPFFLNDFEVIFALHITNKVNDSVFNDIRITFNRSEDSDQFTGHI